MVASWIPQAPVKLLSWRSSNDSYSHGCDTSPSYHDGREGGRRQTWFLDEHEVADEIQLVVSGNITCVTVLEPAAVSLARAQCDAGSGRDPSSDTARVGRFGAAVMGAIGLCWCQRNWSLLVGCRSKTLQPQKIGRCASILSDASQTCALLHRPPYVQLPHCPALHRPRTVAPPSFTAAVDGLNEIDRPVPRALWSWPPQSLGQSLVATAVKDPLCIFWQVARPRSP